jgi:hypothetical protein
MALFSKKSILAHYQSCLANLDLTRYKVIYNGFSVQIFDRKTGLLCSPSDSIPAYMCPTLMTFRRNGCLYRDNGAASISSSIIAYYKNGKLHRDGDEPAYISWCFGKKWARNGHVYKEHSYLLEQTLKYGEGKTVMSWTELSEEDSYIAPETWKKALKDAMPPKNVTV